MKQEIKFEYLKLSDLTPYERNTRNHDRRSIDFIKNSIRETLTGKKAEKLNSEHSY